MNKIKVYYPPELFREKDRGDWFELIKSKERWERKQRPIDGKIQAVLTWVEDRVDADVWILPMNWNVYFFQNKQDQALAFCRVAEKLGKRVLSFTGGDQGITLDLPSNVTVYRQSGYRSKFRENEKTAPFFLSDPVGKFVETEEDLFYWNPNAHPKVGFCGMAPHGLGIELKERVQVFLRNKRQKAGQQRFDPQEVMSSSNLRYKTLQVFEQHAAFDTNYIIRQKYRGGEKTSENRKKTTLEYYHNQVESDLITCVRGVGNYSLRFYETLAMGRIPVFVDTDTPLPDIGNQDWNDYIVWIDRKDVRNAAIFTEEWLKRKDFPAQFRKSRELWKTYFRLDGFWLNELKSIHS